LIRDAAPADVEQLLRLIRELAEFERALDAVEATEEDLREALFCSDSKVFALVAEEAGAVVGMAIYFLSFSTWTGRHGLYLEDLFVVPEHRSRGVGRELVTALAVRAVQLGCSRVEWAVLDWNEAAISFYEALGAQAMGDWTTFRLSGPSLAALGGRPDS
jgi:GNAT superfamily N-acetyltransferase